MLRFEYDSVVAWHPYRTYQPWDHGGVRLLQVDGVNGLQDDARMVRDHLYALETRVLEDAIEAGIAGARRDNHYGFTVVQEPRWHGDRARWYQLRFSDGSLYVWLMPGPPCWEI